MSSKCGTDDIVDAIVDHYSIYDEDARLKHDIGSLERARTQELIRRYLPSPPAEVLDVGGATGVYAFWLAGLGYRVHLVDIVPRHIERARRRARRPDVPALASARVGDARALEIDADVAEVVILHGPLYHLPQRDDRVRALREARRVLRPGGLLLAFAITRYAGLIYGLSQGHVFDPQYHRMIRDEVRTGRREDPPDWAFTFPSAYFHHPDELEGELEDAGLVHEVTLGIIGPAWQVPDLAASWEDPTRREVLMDLARLTEHEPVLGPRLMAVGRSIAVRDSASGSDV